MSRERSWDIKAAELSQTIDKAGIVVGAGFVLLGSASFGIILIGSSAITYVGAEAYKKSRKKR